MAPNVGARRARVRAGHIETPIDLIALYPTAADEAPLRVGPYTIDVAIEGATVPVAPFPPDMVNAAFPPSQDPPGFDRAAFHAELYPDVEAFFRRTVPA